MSIAIGGWDGCGQFAVDGYAAPCDVQGFTRKRTPVYRTRHLTARGFAALYPCSMVELRHTSWWDVRHYFASLIELCCGLDVVSTGRKMAKICLNPTQMMKSNTETAISPRSILQTWRDTLFTPLYHHTTKIQAKFATKRDRRTEIAVIFHILSILRASLDDSDARKEKDDGKKDTW